MMLILILKEFLKRNLYDKNIKVIYLDLEEFNRRAYEKMERQLHLPLSREQELTRKSILSYLNHDLES